MTTSRTKSFLPHFFQGKKLWGKPWGYLEGVAVCVLLMLVGAALQFVVGPIIWSSFAAPVNVIFLCVYLLLIVVAYYFRKRIYVVRWCMTYQAAVPAILVAGLSTLIYGITCDRDTLSALPFVLVYFWMTTILGLTSLKHWKNLPFLLNHLGLFIAIVCATLGSADMKRLRMTVVKGEPEWRALDQDTEGQSPDIQFVNYKVVQLDFAVMLNKFTIEEYPPKLLVVSNETGVALPEDNPASLTLEDSVIVGDLLGHKIKVEKWYTHCALTADSSSVNYIPFSKPGATTAALISIDGKTAEWVSNGSYMFPYRPIRIDDNTSLVMPECEAKRYTSNVNIYTKDGKKIENVNVEVNHPIEVDGWKIYQLSYDDSKGRWSDASVLELVRDPWLPFVYLGIFMLIGGAIWLFITAGGKRHD